MKSDLRDEEPSHKAYKEGLRRNTHQMKQIDKAYYDPTLVPEHHYIEEQNNEMHRAFLARSAASNAKSLADYQQAQHTHDNIRDSLLFGLHSLSDYRQNHRQLAINKSRVQSHELEEEVLPAVNQKSP